MSQPLTPILMNDVEKIALVAAMRMSLAALRSWQGSESAQVESGAESAPRAGEDHDAARWLGSDCVKVVTKLGNQRGGQSIQFLRA
jgi:hypothetical protein